MTRPHPTCQFIADEPSHDDACKCGAPAIAGQPWCQTHYDTVFGTGQRDQVHRDQHVGFLLPVVTHGVMPAFDEATP